MNGTDKRDRAIDRQLRRSLKSASAHAPTPACLDAETAAAWMDGTLTGAALETAQMHAADCERCQALLAAIVQVSTPAAAAPHEARRWWAWLVPLTAAAAIAIWAWLPRPSAPPGAEPATTMARVEPREPAQPEAAPPKEEVAAPAASQGASRREADALQDRAKVLANNQAAEPKPTAAPPPPVAQAAPAAAPTPAAASTPAAAPASAAVPAPAPLAAPAPPPPPASAERRTGALAETVRADRSPVVVQMPGGAVQWRLAGARVERSSDAGASWAETFTGTTELAAGVSPQANVCWIVGRGGTVLRSVDGRDFSRLSFPETIDLVAVRASDAARAEVTTADGRTFSTTDGGASWRPRLQDF